MNKYLSMISCVVSSSLIMSGCVHTGTGRNPTPVSSGSMTYQNRTNIAANTCDAQYKKDRQNYLSAVQSVIASGQSLPNASGAPLDRFRAEINAAYNTVVMRCKTHMHCLEYQNYNEAACYMAASDRKDAERRFSDLSTELRKIGRSHHAKASNPKKHGKRKPGVNVTINQTNDLRNSQRQSSDPSQTNNNHNGDLIEDQDVLVLCSDAKNLLDSRCRNQ